MIAFGDCPVCRSGQVGFRQCSDRQTLVLLCQECAMLWTDPDRFDAAHALDPLDPGLKRRRPGVDLQPSRWATLAQIQEYGWGAFVLTPSQLLGLPPEA